MARVRLDRLVMDQQAQAQGQSALYEARNLDPDEVQGFKRRHGSEVPSDGGTVNATGVISRGVNSYLRLDEDFDSGTFSINMSVKLGNLANSGTGDTYHVLAAIRDGGSITQSTTELPQEGWVVYVEQNAAVIKIGFAELSSGAIVDAKEALSADLSASAGDSFFVTASKNGSSSNGMHIRVREVTSAGVLTGSDVVATCSGSPAAGGSDHIVEFLGSEIQGKQGSGSEPIIQNILVYSDNKSAVTMETLTGASSTVKATRTSHTGTNLTYRFLLNADDTYSNAAIKSTVSAKYLHLHPSPPAVLDSALQFGGSSGAFEVPFSSEFLSLFETKVRSVVNDDWTIYIKTTLGPNIGVDQEKTLAEFGKLARIYFAEDGTNSRKLKADVNGSGETAGTTLTTSDQLVIGTEYEIALSRKGDNAHLRYTPTGGATETVSSTIPQNTALDLRRLYSFFLGARENQTVDSYYSGSVTKCALYPFEVTSDAGKDGALFYFDFTGSKYEDQANDLPAGRVYHHSSTQKPVYTLGGNGYQDGSFIGVGGGVVFADSGPLGYTNYLSKPLSSDLHTQQQGHRVILSSGDAAHIVDTRKQETRPLGLPEPGTKVLAHKTGGGTLDGIYSYGYRFVSKYGTPGPMRRLDPVHAFDSASVQLGVTGTGSSDGGESGERELGASQGITESTAVRAGYTTGASYYGINDPGGSDTDLQLFENVAGSDVTTPKMAIDARLAADIPTQLPEAVFNRGVTAADAITDANKTHRWSVFGGLGKTCPPMDQDFAAQVSFRFSDPITGDTSGGDSGNYAHVPLITWQVKDTVAGEGSANERSAPGMMVSLVMGHDSHPGASGYASTSLGRVGSENFWRLAVFRKESGWGHGRGGAHPDSGASTVKTSCHADWARGTDGIAYVDTVHPAYDASAETAPFEASVHADHQFFIDNHDYSVFMTREGDDLHIAAIDVTGLPVDSHDPYTEHLEDRAFHAVHADFFSGFSGAYHGGNDAGKECMFFGGAGAVSNKTGHLSVGGSGVCVTETPRINNSGVKVNGGGSSYETDLWKHQGFHRDTVFYHGRCWSRSYDISDLFAMSWRRDAALPSVTGSTGAPVPGPLSADVWADVGGAETDFLGSTKELWDTYNQTNWRIWSAPFNRNSSSLPPARNIKSVRGGDLPVGGSYNASSNPYGVAERLYPLITIGDAADEYNEQQLRVYVTNLFNGALIIDDSGDDCWIAGKQLWREDDLPPNYLPLDSLAPYQAVDNTEFVFDSSTWYSLLVKAHKDSSNNISFSASNFRINGQGLDTGWGIYQGTIGPNPDTKLTRANLRSADFIFLGGHAKHATNIGSIRFDELRIWDGDRWDRYDTTWHEGGAWSEPNLSGRLESKWAPAADPDQTTNYLLVYAKFQPKDTEEYDTAGGDGAVDDNTELAHYGQWAYYTGSTYGTAREYNTIKAVAQTAYTNAEPGMVHDYPSSGSEEGPPDTPISLAFPEGPKHSVAAIELFRSPSIKLSEQQREDEDTLARSTEAAKGAPLQLLARLPRHDRSFVDSVLDENLGEEVDDTHGASPPDVVKGVFTWQDQLALISDQRNIYFAEPGPYGWESFPDWLVYQVPVDIGGGEITAGAELGQGAIVAGKSWAAVLTGTPSSPDAFSLGGGVGAYDAHNLIAHAGAAYAFNGRLWRIDTQGQVTEISKPVENYLPGASQGKLSISAKLSSLFLLNTSTGLALRFHFPSGRWFVEDRGAIDMGDLSDGEDAWISAQGVYAKGATGQVGDFLPNGATSIAASYNANISATGGSAAANKVELDTGSWATGIFKAGVQVSVVKDAAVTGGTGDSDIYASGVVSSVSSGEIILDLGTDAAGAARTLATLGFADDDEVTVYVGGPALVDSGPIYTNDDMIFAATELDIISGSGWHIGMRSTEVAGDQSDTGSVDFVAVSTTGANTLGGAEPGKFHRVIARNFNHEAGAQIGQLEASIYPEFEDGRSSGR